MKAPCSTLLLLVSSTAVTNAWSPSTNSNLSRRDAVATAFGISSAVLTTIVGTSPQPALAAATAAPGAPTTADMDRLKKGYAGLQYLLDNFEQETTVCRENGGECKRNADAIRKAMGLRSTTDPLFQIEKVFNKVKNMDLDVDILESFFEATEDWNSAMNMSNSMAFISEFGEYNPGGGKDQVLKYLNESKIQVELATKSLGTIITALTAETQ